MKSSAQVAGHPIHPMLIPYPFALLSGAVGFDVAEKMTGRREFGQTAAHLNTTGLVAALFAAVPGIVDYFGTVPPGSAARRTATWHACFNSAGLVMFAWARARRAQGREGVLPLGLLGTACLSAGGLLGGTLVYKHQVGVETDRAQIPLGAEDRLTGYDSKATQLPGL